MCEDCLKRNPLAQGLSKVYSSSSSSGFNRIQAESEKKYPLMHHWGICCHIFKDQKDSQHTYPSIDCEFSIWHQILQHIIGFSYDGGCDMMELSFKGIGKRILMSQFRRIYHFSVQSTQINSNCILKKRFERELVTLLCCDQNTQARKDS